MSTAGNKERIWVFPISSVVNFGALILLFTTILFLHQLAQKSTSDKSAVEVAAASAKTELEVKVVKKIKDNTVEEILPVKPLSRTPSSKIAAPKPSIMALIRKEIILDEKIPGANDPLRESLAARKRTLAMGNFIPFEKTRP